MSSMNLPGGVGIIKFVTKKGMVMMKMRIKSGFVLVCFASLAVGAFSGENLFPNSNFEKFDKETPVGWKFGSWNPAFSKERISKSSPGHGGMGNCVKLQFNSAIVAANITSDSIKVKPASTYVFKGYYASTFGRLHKIAVTGTWKKSDGRRIRSFLFRLPPTQDQWCPFFRELKSPLKATSLVVKIVMKWDDGCVRFDDFSLREGSLRDYATEFHPAIKNGVFFPIYAWIPPGEYRFYNTSRYPKKAKYFASDEMQAQYAAANFTVGTKAIFGMKRKLSWPEVSAANMNLLTRPEAIWGFLGKDEPRETLFAKLAKDKNALLKFAEKHKLPNGKLFTDGKPIFNNLLPIYAFKKKPVEEYKEYLRKYIKQVKPTFLTYDYYPLTGADSKYGESWFSNLEIFRKAAMKANLPFGVFCASAAFCGVRSPNESEMRWEAFSTLCYGARYLGWFTFLRQINGEGLRDTIIDEFGDRTQHYSMVRRINAEVLALAPILLKIKSTAVYHTLPLPDETADIADSKLLSVKTDAQLLLGEFEDELDASAKYFMLVNKDFVNAGKYELRFKAPVSELYEVSKSTGGLVKVAAYDAATGKVEISLKPGDGALFKVGK